jgi:hypothetical protein
MLNEITEECKHVKIRLSNLQNSEKVTISEHSHTGNLSRIKLCNNFNASLYMKIYLM